MFICGTEFFWAEYGCWFCFGFVLVLLFRMCIVYLDIFEIVFWSFPIGWRMRGWFTMLFLMGFFDGECFILGDDVYFVFSF